MTSEYPRPPPTKQDVATGFVSGSVKKTPVNLQRFLKTLRATANVTSSARSISCTRRILYMWRKEPDLYVEVDGELVHFAEAWQDAIEEATDKLEAYARLWATEGLPEPVVYQGELMYERHPHDDPVLGVEQGQLVLDANGNPKPLVVHQRNQRMLEILLKAHRPEKFRENVAVDLAVSGGVLLLREPTPVDEGGESWEDRAEGEQAAYRGGATIEAEAVDVTPVRGTDG